MYKCRECGCNCDNADIRNGLCDSCRDKAERLKEKHQMLISGCGQMEFSFCAAYNIHRQQGKTYYKV